MIRKLILTGCVFVLGSTAIAAPIQPAGGGGVDRGDFRDDISPRQRALIQQELEVNRSLLREQGVLSRPETVSALATQPLFDWPTLATTTDPGHFGISNFVDHDATFPDSVKDYNCGTRTYDTVSGYNHTGTDVFAWPFPWLKMDADEVRIVAAEAGVIIGKSDGNFDRNCSFTGDWNAVFVEHDDGSVAWYGHMKKNSLTAKSIGQAVQAGEFLGVMGSSGFSTGPHLHFEVYDSGNNLIDPSAGACNSLNPGTWWSSQRPYYEPAINLVATHDAPPVLDNGCGVAETPNFQQVFTAGQKAYFALYLRDQQAGQLLELKIYQPDGTIWQQWTFSMDSPAHYAASWWYWWRILPTEPQTGTWRWSVQFQGQSAESEFTVGDAVFTDGFENPGN